MKMHTKISKATIAPMEGAPPVKATPMRTAVATCAHQFITLTSFPSTVSYILLRFI